MKTIFLWFSWDSHNLFKLTLFPTADSPLIVVQFNTPSRLSSTMELK